MEETPTTTVQPEVVKKPRCLRMPGQFIFLLATGFLAIVIAAFIIIPTNKKTTNQIEPLPTIPPIPTQETKNPTSGWKTYAHNLYTIQYPDTFQVGSGQFDSSDASIVRIAPNKKEPFTDAHLIIIIDPDKNKSDLNTLANNNYQANINHPGIPAQSVSKPTSGTFNGLESIEYSLKNKGFISPREEYLGYNGVYKAIWVHAVDNNFLIYYTNTPEVVDILSTFKFAE